MKMRLTLFRIFFIAIVAVGAQPAVRAQEDLVPLHNVPGGTVRGRGSVSGRVVLPSGQPVNQRIRLVISYMADAGITYYTDNNGAFGFSGLGEGLYTIEATGDTRLYETVSQEVRVARGMHLKLLINLKEKSSNAEKKPAGNVVSVAELDKNVPPAAKKEFDVATRLANEGKVKEAVQGFKQAIAIYPGYLMARNDLGVQYLKLRLLAQAQEQFEAALEINSKTFNPRLNLGIVLFEQKKYLDAVEHLNQAISIDKSVAASHLYLGIVAIEIDDLETAEREIPLAYSLGGEEYAVTYFYQAQIHLKKGEREPAIRALETYLKKLPKGELVTRARLLLDELK
jgi:Tfp pilus assembly protein PilF